MFSDVVVFFSLVFRFFSIGCIVCMMKGRLMKISVSSMFSGVKVILVLLLLNSGVSSLLGVNSVLI